MPKIGKNAEEIIKVLKREEGIGVLKSIRILNHIFGTITDILIRDHFCKIQSFGTLRVINRPFYMGRLEGKSTEECEKVYLNVVLFRPASSIKKALNTTEFEKAIEEWEELKDQEFDERLLNREQDDSSDGTTS